jgi:hypothetical protein
VVAVGGSILLGIGFARTPAALARAAGLAFVAGWSAAGIVVALALAAGASLDVAIAAFIGVVPVALVVARFAPGVAVGRCVPPTLRHGRVLAISGASTLILCGLMLLRRAQLSDGPFYWDTWWFWLPKANSILYFNGLELGPNGFTSWTNPDYPPLVPAMHAVVFRVAGEASPGTLALELWVLEAAFIAALAVLLAPRVSSSILWPSLAILVLLPDFRYLVASFLGDEQLAVFFVCAGIAACRWVLDGDVRFLCLTSLFLTAAVLAKNEGSVLALVLLAALAMTVGRGRRTIASLAAAAVPPLLGFGAWRLWLQAHDVPATPAFRPTDLLRPGYLIDRVERLKTSVADVSGLLVSTDRWLLTLPLVVIAAVAVLRVHPRLASVVVATLVLEFIAIVTVYWASPYPLEYVIATSAHRVVSPLAIFLAAVLPLLVSEALSGTSASAYAGEPRRTR